MTHLAPDTLGFCVRFHTRAREKALLEKGDEKETTKKYVNEKTKERKKRVAPLLSRGMIDLRLGRGSEPQQQQQPEVAVRADARQQSVAVIAACT